MRVSRSAMTRTAGTVTTNMKICGPSHTVAATMCSQAGMVSVIALQNRLDGDRLLALRPYGEQVRRRSHSLLDAPHVGAGVFGQVLEAPHAGGVLLPARQLFVYGLRSRQHRPAGRQRIGRRAVQSICRAHLEGG